MKTFCKISLITSLWVISLEINAQNSFEKVYGGNGSELGFDICTTADTGYLIAARTGTTAEGFDIWLIKVDRNGDTLWTRTFDIGDFESCEVILETPDGGIFIAGELNNDSLLSAAFIMKTNHYGDSVRTRIYPYFSEFIDGLQTLDGSFVLIYRGVTPYDDDIVKINSEGDTLWKCNLDRMLNGWLFDAIYATSVTEDAGGNYFVTGNSYPGWSRSEGYAYLSKINPSGDTLWTRSLNNPEVEEPFFISDIINTSDDGFLLAGSDGNYTWIYKTDSAANLLWKKEYSSSQTSEEWHLSYGMTSIDKTGEGGYIIADKMVCMDMKSRDYYDYIRIMCTDQNGDTLWTRKIYDRLISQYSNVIQALDDGYVLTGYTNIEGQDSDVWLYKSDVEGQVTDVNEYALTNPDDYMTLNQNYPNPFTDQTRITFFLEKSMTVKLKVTDLLNNELHMLVDDFLQPGRYTFTLKTGDLPSGIYLCRLQADDTGQCIKMFKIN